MNLNKTKKVLNVVVKCIEHNKRIKKVKFPTILLKNNRSEMWCWVEWFICNQQEKIWNSAHFTKKKIQKREKISNFDILSNNNICSIHTHNLHFLLLIFVKENPKFFETFNITLRVYQWLLLIELFLKRPPQNSFRQKPTTKYTN